MPRQFRITVNGIDYQVAVEELGAAPTVSPVAAPVAAPVVPVAPVAAAPAPAAPAAVPAAGADDVVAQMGGVIAQVFVKPGDVVNDGFRLLELEAMKMKIPVLAPRAGTVAHVHVAAGDPVDIGQALVSIG